MKTKKVILLTVNLLFLSLAVKTANAVKAQATGESRAAFIEEETQDRSSSVVKTDSPAYTGDNTKRRFYRYPSFFHGYHRYYPGHRRHYHRYHPGHYGYHYGAYGYYCR